MYTLALLATYQETADEIRILARMHGAPLWIKISGKRLEAARKGILKHYFSMMEACGQNPDTVLMHTVHLNGRETGDTVSAEAWSWADLRERRTGGWIERKQNVHQ